MPVRGVVLALHLANHFHQEQQLTVRGTRNGRIEADIGNMPGAAVMGPAGAAAVVATNVAMSGVKSYKSAAATQAKDIVKKIADELAKYFAQQGWIDPSLAR